MSIYFRDAWENIVDIGKTAAISFLIISALYVFQFPIIALTKEVFVEHLFEKPIFNSLTDFLGIILFFSGVTYLCVQLFRNKLYPTPKSLIVYLSIVTVYYLVFKNHKEFHLYEIFNNSTITYLGIAYWILPLFFLRYRAYAEVKINESSPSFFEDKFDEKKNSDIFSRKGVADKISELVNNTVTQSAFAIAIIGKWGSGKSVFLTFLQKGLKKENEIIHFNPWKVKDIKQIYDSFFKSLSKTVAKYDKNASKQIKEYADYLIEIDDENFFSKVIKSTIESFEKENDLFEKFDAINKSLKLIGKRFVIFVDDLDRLTGKEIIQTLKLIRNSADFSNVFFIVALDYEYATATMTKTKEVAFEEKYLQKIFQYEFVLAPIRKDFILIKLREMLAIDSMDPNEKTQFDLAFNRLFFDKTDYVLTLFPENTFEGDLEVAIENMRDLTRFVNSFKIIYNRLKGEIEIYDLIMLELIKLKSVFAYQLIAERKIIKSSENHAQKHFILDLTTFDDLFSNSDNVYKEVIKTLIENLFQSRTEKSPRSIIYPGSFEIYIYQELFQNISLKEWNISRIKPALEFYEKIKEWVRDDKSGSVEQLLSSMNTFANITEFEKYIKVFLLLGSTPSNRTWLTNAYSFFIRKEFLMKQYRVTENDLQNLLIRIINDVDISYYAKSEFASFFLLEFIQNINIPIGTKEFWNEQLMNIFTDFVNKSDNIANPISYEIYWNLIDRIDPNDNHLILTPAANEKMKEYLMKVKNDYGKYILRPYNNPPDDKFTFDPWLIQIFGSIEEVIDFINSIDSNDELTKFAKSYLSEYQIMHANSKEYFVINDNRELNKIMLLINFRNAH
ncbi:MAG: P-loop NTPase fold protein [Bacteroidota bacterium]